jgi:4-amino-4-deoxy-L-arabinose transferase-like glycosyltransferase
VWKTARVFSSDRAWTVVALLASTLGGIASGFLLTPDTGLMLMWSIALHESVVAIRNNPKRWLTAGLATGIGLLSKYTMVLIGPVFLWGLIRDAKKQLLSPWPYLGGLVCLLVFLPHLWWQSENNWITAKFQFGHGFSVKQSLVLGSTLPPATSPPPDSPNMILRQNLFSALTAAPGFAELDPKPKPEKSKWERAWQYTGDFAGGVIGLWGVYGMLWFMALISRLRRPAASSNLAPPPGLAIIDAGAFFPLIFFGILSPFTKIEANWPAMHMAALTIWVCSRSVVSTRTMAIATTIHITLLAGLAWILTFPESIPGARSNRMLLESKGYKALGEWVRDTYPHQAIAVDSYQLKSAIRYYAPETPVAQWPGITRGSEYTRGFADDVTVERALLSQSDLTVIAMNSYPQVIEGYEAVSFEGMRVCPDGRIGTFSVIRPILPCEKGLREWWITTYHSTSSR